MTELVTREVAVVLMYTGIVPSVTILYLLFDDRDKPGVLWFLVLMATAAAWALLYGTFTALESPELTLALANFFWAAVPTAAIAMFLLAYEYVFRTVASRGLVAILFAPVVALFLLSWPNPASLVFTPAYQVAPDGFLVVPPLGGPVRILVTKVYGFLLVALAAGMFVGETLRSTGRQWRQTLSLLLILTAVAATTLVKITGMVPEYFDPTSAAYSVSGLVFAYSISTHGLLKFVPVAREESFQAVEDIIVVVDPEDVVVEVNRPGQRVLEDDIIGKPLNAVLPEVAGESTTDEIPTVERSSPHGTRYYTWKVSRFAYGRGLTGRLVVLSDITEIKQRRDELDLLKQILTRIFRHNMRNDLTVIEGFATEIEEDGDDPIADMAARIRDRAARLLQESEKAQELEKLFAQQEPVPVSIREEVDRVVSPYDGRGDVILRTAVDDVRVAAHPQFGLALEEVIQNAISHHDSADPPEIAIATEVTADRVVLRVEDDGPGIPPAEIAVLDAERETTLEHSSGLGLWFVKLVVMRGDGDLEIESSEAGTRIRIHLQRRDTGDDSPLTGVAA